jgi:hypothetical protein
MVDRKSARRCSSSLRQSGELFALDALVTPTAQGIASRVLARTAAGNITCMPSMRVKSCRSIPRHSMRSSSRYRGLSSYSAHGPLKLTTLSVVQSTFGAMAASAARAVLGRVLLHQSDEALAHLRGVLAWSCHGSILSTRMGPPTIPARFRTGFPNQDADAIFAEHNCTIQLTAVACGGTFTSSQWSPTCL